MKTNSTDPAVAPPAGLVLTTESVLALRESERRFQAISDCTCDWESWHGPDGKLLWVNHAVARLTGYSIPECLSMAQYPLPIVRESDRPRIAEVLQQAATGIRGNDLEFCILTRDGHEHWGAISWQSIADDNGVNMGFRASIRDIADRKRMEQQIRDYAENLEQLIQEQTAADRRRIHLFEVGCYKTGSTGKDDVLQGGAIRVFVPAPTLASRYRRRPPRSPQSGNLLDSTPNIRY
jgi:PAS domain S-box-containing protein